MTATSTPFGNAGALNGSTVVTVLSAPSSGQQKVVGVNGLSVQNLDTVEHTYTVQRDIGGTKRIIAKQLVAAGNYWYVPKTIVLSDTTHSLEVKYEAVATTTESTYDVAAMLTT